MKTTTYDNELIVRFFPLRFTGENVTMTDCKLVVPKLWQTAIVVKNSRVDFVGTEIVRYPLLRWMRVKLSVMADTRRRAAE